jgi:hypothetical protein
METATVYNRSIDARNLSKVHLDYGERSYWATPEMPVTNMYASHEGYHDLTSTSLIACPCSFLLSDEGGASSANGEAELALDNETLSINQGLATRFTFV